MYSKSISTATRLRSIVTASNSIKVRPLISKKRLRLLALVVLAAIRMRIQLHVCI